MAKLTTERIVKNELKHLIREGKETPYTKKTREKEEELTKKNGSEESGQELKLKKYIDTIGPRKLAKYSSVRKLFNCHSEDAAASYISKKTRNAKGASGGNFEFRTEEIHQLLKVCRKIINNLLT